MSKFYNPKNQKWDADLAVEYVGKFLNQQTTGAKDFELLKTQLTKDDAIFALMISFKIMREHNLRFVE